MADQNPFLTWRRADDEDEGSREVHYAGAGAMELGLVRSMAQSPQWRWEIVALPGLQGMDRDRRGVAATREEAMRAVEGLFSKWIATAFPSMRALTDPATRAEAHRLIIALGLRSDPQSRDASALLSRLFGEPIESHA